MDTIVDSLPNVTKSINNIRKLKLDQPRYDQSTFDGRAKHFFITTNPMNLFVSAKRLNESKEIVEKYRSGDSLLNLSDDEIWRAKNLYDSAFHPDTKEKMLIIGRMSAQVPMNMTITGCMMTFRSTTPAVLFWQWINQSFNAIVNYTNRSGDEPISVQEVTYGVPIFDENGNSLGESTAAAKKAIFQVVFSRVAMATPGMLIPPFIMQFLEKKRFMKARPWLNAPIQVGLVGLFLVFATPLCCALFPQKSSIGVSHLEPEIRDKIMSLKEAPSRVFFNKGL